MFFSKFFFLEIDNITLDPDPNSIYLYPQHCCKVFVKQSLKLTQYFPFLF